MFIRFEVIHERDRRTDGRTLHDSIDRACIASRGNNKLYTALSCSETAKSMHMQKDENSSILQM